MDTTPEQAAEGMALVRVLSAVLDRLVCANAALARADPGQITKFHALKAPGIGVLQYLERIHKYASCSNECFILALIYIDRLIQRNNFLLTELNVHRVVITAILLAAKFFDDAYYNNAYYAKKYRAELVSHSVGAGLTPSPELHASPVMTSTTSPLISSTHAMTTQPIETKSQALHHTDYGQLPFGTSTRHPPTHPMHITPSPPPPTAHRAAPPLHVASGGSGEMLVSAPSGNLNPEQPCGLAFRAASDAALVGAHQVSMLQRHNSLPVAPSGLTGALIAAGATPPYPGQQAPSSMSMPVGVSPPVLATAGVLESTEKYIVVDNVAYPVHGGLVHYQHAPATNVDLSLVSNSGGFHHNSNGQPAHVTTNQRFVNGQMLA